MTEAMTHERSCPRLARWRDDCTCGLEWRIALSTEQTMHAAWRKRAGEAEAELEIRRINAKEAVRILSAVEFDGQAYDAITAAIKLIDRSAVTVGASKC